MNNVESEGPWSYRTSDTVPPYFQILKGEEVSVVPITEEATAQEIVRRLNQSERKKTHNPTLMD